MKKFQGVMKKICQFKLIGILLVTFAFSHCVSSQDSTVDELRFEVRNIYPPLSITNEQLIEAGMLSDLHKHYNETWVREYYSVEIATIHDGVTRKTIAKNSIISKEQKDYMRSADVGSNISVEVHYLPENTLKHNDPKEFTFSFMVNPLTEAEYPGGEEKLNSYLKEKAIDKVVGICVENNDLTIVKFMVSEKGEVNNAHIFGNGYRSSTNELMDKILIDAILDMPLWKPAKFSNGKKNRTGICIAGW